MRGERKLEVLRAVEGCGVPVGEALSKLEVCASTYYRWRRRFRIGGAEALNDRKPYRERNWNQLLPLEQAHVLEVALRYPERSSREISCQVADTCGFTVSQPDISQSRPPPQRPRGSVTFDDGALDGLTSQLTQPSLNWLCLPMMKSKLRGP